MDAIVRTLRMLVITTDKYPPFRVDVSVLFGRELASRGFAIDWVLQSQDSCDRAYETPWAGCHAWVGATDLGLGRRHRIRKHWLGLKHDLTALRRARAESYDVIEVKDKILAAVPALRAARESGASFVYWLSFPHPEASTYLAKIGAARYPLLYRLRGWFQFQLLYRYVLPRADHVFVQSEQMKRDLEGYGLDPRRMTSVPMGVEMAELATVHAKTSLSTTIAYLGTLAGERRIDFLVRCLALVVRDVPDARLLLVGAGDRPGDTQALLDEAERLGVRYRVEITGFLPRLEALERVAGAAVCVSPFFPTPILNSTSPTKLVEYMALGRPVVANDHPEQRLVIAESGGGLCVPYEEAPFAEAIVQLLRDPARGNDMGARGREYVERERDYARIASKVENRFRALASG